MAVSASIRKYRLQRQLPQAELATRIGKRRVTSTRYELGSVDIPVSVLGEIAKALKSPSASSSSPTARTTQPSPG